MVSSMTTRQLPDSVTIAFPDDWTDFPLEVDRFQQFRQALIDRLADEGSLSRNDIRTVEVFLSQIRRYATEHNVIMSAGMIQYQPIEGEDEVKPLAASALVARITRSELGIDVPLLPEVLLPVFADGSREGNESMRYDHIEPPAITSIGAHQCVRLLRLLTISKPGHEDHRLFVESYLVPVAEGDGVIVMQFSTINYDYARPFSDLFTSIAASLRVLYPDDPTFEGQVAEGTDDQTP